MPPIPPEPAPADHPHEASGPDAELRESAPGTRMPRIRSEALFGATRQVCIVHGEEEYYLRITRSGKLILQK